MQQEMLPAQVKEAFNAVDMILHAGDIWIPSVLDELETVAPVKAAWGDDDMEADFVNDERMMRGEVLTLEGVTIWMSHVKPRYSRISLREWSYVPRFKKDSNPEDGKRDHPKVVIFGHTHSAAIEPYEDVLLVNPGSATVPEYLPRLGTVGLLTIDDGKVSARIVQLEPDKP